MTTHTKVQSLVFRTLVNGGIIIKTANAHYPFQLIDEQKNPVRRLHRRTFKGFENKKLIFKNSEGHYVINQDALTAKQRQRINAKSDIPAFIKKYTVAAVLNCIGIDKCKDHFYLVDKNKCK